MSSKSLAQVKECLRRWRELAFQRSPDAPLDHARGDEAERFLNSELVRSFFEETEGLLYHRWASTEPGEQEKRERIYYQVQLLDSFKRYLDSAIDNGRMAAQFIDQFDAVAGEQRR